MNAERSRLYYTTVFLHVSFQAIKHSLAGKESDALPCWLDTRMLMMLSAELKGCRDRAIALGEVRRPLDAACDHCEILLAQCPGALTSTICHRHLNAILAPLHDVMDILSAPTPLSPTSVWQAATRRLRQRWERQA
ncbi:hypothetical protein [Halomonas korlensis]|uniref:Uncharacterized protein n=1 Tax=Halomonas korlensis TaxID=463301 RepID=A0A1I7KBW9_9GAMM|nr:hypothetical protein [Halomonas korlensis]SFU94913.1 hypothetical protein SAMN04487955_11749 [Halomonas korlensis]